MNNKHPLLVWEEVSTTRRNICKTLRRFMSIFSFFLQVLYKWIPLSFTLGYHPRTQIPHNEIDVTRIRQLTNVTVCEIPLRIGYSVVTIKILIYLIKTLQDNNTLPLHLVLKTKLRFSLPSFTSFNFRFVF